MIDELIMNIEEKSKAVDSSKKDILNQIIDCLKELKEYKELESDGKLVKLPCKVGQILYYINGPYILDAEVIEFWIDECGVWNILTNVYQNTDTYELQVNPENLGSTVFLTREEAEEKLKKKELIKELTIGCNLYYINLLQNIVLTGILTSIETDESNQELLHVKFDDAIIQFNIEDIGYILFLTKEDAENKLKNYTC